MNAKSAEHRHLLLQLGQEARNSKFGEARNSKFCKSLKLLSACRLSSRFTFAPRLLFHVARATAYQAVRYTAEIMQTGDATR